MHCTSLESVIIPDSVVNIYYSFWECSALTSIEIPSSVRNIYKPFDTCPALKEIYIYNPTCAIADGLATAGLQQKFKGTVYGYDNSTAESYALKQGFTFSSLGKAPISEDVRGDLNCDGRANIQDAILLARIITEDKTVKTNDAMLAAADVNRDNEIDVFDTVMLLKDISSGR